ncbi:Ldh family oxidoreductase [uncultured Marivita sp.]|uniref:Ldh family oxidoreductase n=1 Tax=uncultured Marivita sp. TaxID=888080 RepID=UPI002638DFC3|nr:Ldh family oxidoreductase [uncultured Marivita sp.]
MAFYPKTETDLSIEKDRLLNTVTAVFAACGMPDTDAATLAGTLVHSDMRGVHSHGVLRVPDYVGKMTREGVNPAANPKVISQKGGALVVDADNGMGQIGGTFAMDRAISAAREHGLAYAAVRNSNHCGALDWYAMRAAAKGMVGICGTNALPTMAPWGGKDKIVGINPLSVACPAEQENDLVLDFAFGETAHGKIRVYHQKGEPIPEGWAFDEDGFPTTDAGRALTGLIQPIGAHKGIGLGMMVGILSSLLSGAGYGLETGNMVHGPTAGKDGQFYLAIDIAAFVDPAEFRRRIDGIVAQVHGSARRDGVERLYVPGEIEAGFEAHYAAEGITLARTTVEDINAAVDSLGVAASHALPLADE